MSNVISMFDRRKQEEPKTIEQKDTEEQLKAVAERNKKNTERVAKERANDNKSVLRSYRIKH